MPLHIDTTTTTTTTTITITTSSSHIITTTANTLAFTKVYIKDVTNINIQQF
jgi:hypothetical protein